MRWARASLLRGVSPRSVFTEIHRAIEEPAHRAGCELEMGLTEILIQDVERQSGALPLLQFALRELWEKRQGPDS
jgi:hypothetical protein